jgi:hypothetical protein
MLGSTCFPCCATCDCVLPSRLLATVFFSGLPSPSLYDQAVWSGFSDPTGGVTRTLSLVRDDTKLSSASQSPFIQSGSGGGAAYVYNFLYESSDYGQFSFPGTQSDAGCVWPDGIVQQECKLQLWGRDRMTSSAPDDACFYWSFSYSETLWRTKRTFTNGVQVSATCGQMTRGAQRLGSLSVTDTQYGYGYRTRALTKSDVSAGNCLASMLTQKLVPVWEWDNLFGVTEQQQLARSGSLSVVASE